MVLLRRSLEAPGFESWERMKNFTGYSTMSTRAMSALRIRSSWFQQSRDERKRRLRLIFDLVRELDRIRAQDHFCTGLGEACIESVIEGDWRMVREWRGHFTFVDEGPVVSARYAPIWATFVRHIDDALMLMSGNGVA